MVRIFRSIRKELLHKHLCYSALIQADPQRLLRQRRVLLQLRVLVQHCFLKLLQQVFRSVYLQVFYLERVTQVLRFSQYLHPLFR